MDEQKNKTKKTIPVEMWGTKSIKSQNMEILKEHVEE